MAKILRKQKIFRFDERTYELLEMAKKHHIPLSRFVRQAISEKFERDQPLWIEEQRKQTELQCPF